MLTKIRLKNFKAFRDTGSLEIAPLTVLTGQNSSGKSAILRAMMALRQTVESRDQSTAFVSTGEYVNLGTFEELAFKHDVKSSVGFHFVSKVPSAHHTFMGMELPFGEDQRELSVSLDLAYLSSIDRIYLVRSMVHLGKGGIQVHKETMRGKQLGRSYRTSVRFLADKSGKLGNSSTAQFHRVPPYIVTDAVRTASRESKTKISPGQGKRLISTQFAKIVEESVSQELASLHYIGPLREQPRRMYLSTGETPREVGTAGELGPAVLWSASEARQLDSVKLSEWCSRMGLAFEIRLTPVQGGYFQVLVVDPYTRVSVNIQDVGVGTSQLLPILVQGLIAPHGSTLLLEQPEIHLHPKVQADLADFLIDVTRREVGVIVETHSEHLITRLQRRIAEESLDPKEVAVYFVTPSPEGSAVEQVQVNEYGQIPAAPDGFFEEGFEETFDFMRAVGQRKTCERLARDSE